MKKVFVSVDQCRAGMQVAENVFNEYGAIIVSQNTTISENTIKRLKELGILKVRVYVESEEVINVEHTQLVKLQYQEDINVVKEVLHEVSLGKNLNIGKVNKVSDSIMNKINDKCDIITCINEISGIDDYTYSHSVNVSFLCMMMAKWMDFDYKKTRLLVQAGLLHDIGKSKIPQEILTKKGNLSDEEFGEVKKHTVYGYKIAEAIPNINKDVLKGILMHHEREDGSGYPIGIKGDEIHEFAKIIAVADIYDAMTSDRVYKERQSPFKVFELMENKSFGVLDTEVRTVFLNNIANYYIGEKVRLSTGDTAEVIYINKMYISQPVVKIGNKYVDLSTNRNLKITHLL